MAINDQDLDWNLLRAFLAIVEAGSLVRAAQRLGTSQPTLSRKMAALEASVGVCLFERTSRGLVPTSAGLALVEPAQRMRAALVAASSALSQDMQTLPGTVRLSASEVVSAFVLPRMLARLARRHPSIEVELVASDNINNLLDREADLAVRMVRPSQSGVIARHVADWPLGLYAHVDYLTSVGGEIKSHELSAYRWIGQDQETQLVEGFNAAGIQVDRRFFGFRCDHPIVSVQAIRAGLGIGLTVVPVAQQWHELVRIWPERPTPSLPVWLAAHRELRASQRLKTVFDFLAQALHDFGDTARSAT